MRSEELKSKAASEDNDIVAFGILCKALREKRSEKFIGGWLEPLQQVYPVHERPNGSYMIVTDEYGKIDYFPKANKLLVRKLNKWKKPGLRWIIKNLLKNE